MYEQEIDSSFPSNVMLYEGEISTQEIFQDIDAGFRHFVSAHVDLPAKDFKKYAFSMTFSARMYYTCPVVEILNFYLIKYALKSLSSMSLTALHEAISNSLLWGLLKVERPDDWLEFGRVMEEKLMACEHSRDTLAVGVKVGHHITVDIVNPHDEKFDVDLFKNADNRFPRGMDLISLFSELSYDKETKTLSMTFKGGKDVLEAVTQPQ